MAGTVTRQGVFVPVGGVTFRLPVTAQTVREWVAQVDVCEVCGGETCDCITPAKWTALLADVTPLDVMTKDDLPY